MLKISCAGCFGLSPTIAEQFTLEMCVAAKKNHQKSLKPLSFGFKIIDVDFPKKLVCSACYNSRMAVPICIFMLDKLIFKVDCASVAYLRKFLNIPSVAISAERRRLCFMNKCLSLIDFKQVMPVYAFNCVHRLYTCKCVI